MAIRATTQMSGNWFNSIIWDIGRVPTLGVNATVNHLVYAEKDIVVGSGSLEALKVNMPLVCFKSLSVQGHISGTSGIFFLSPTMDWIFFASEGFELPPVAEDTLRALWENNFGSALPAGYLMPISGRVPSEAFFSPHHHAIITPLLKTLRGWDETYSAQHDPTLPQAKVLYLARTHDERGEPLEPSDVLLRLQELADLTLSAERLSTSLNFSKKLSLKETLAVFGWLKSDVILSVNETEEKFEVLIARHKDAAETLRRYVQVSGIIGMINQILSLTDSPKKVEVLLA